MKVLTFGTFDILYPGHISFLEQAKGYGDYLVAVVGRDETVKKIKGKHPKNNELKRLNRVEGLGLASKVILGDLKDPYKVIKEEKPDIICLGYDQKSFIKNLEEKIKEFKLNTKIVRLKAYKPNKYKSSLL
jgi:FAD synthetase